MLVIWQYSRVQCKEKINFLPKMRTHWVLLLSLLVVGWPSVSRSAYQSISASSGKESINVGLILPQTTFRLRDYTKAISQAISKLEKGKMRNHEFLKRYKFTSNEVHMVLLTVNPSPTAILSALCQEFLSTNVSAILYLTNTELYGRSTASAQYFLQLASYLGIPVIAWNADNSGLERVAGRKVGETAHASLHLQLAPSVEHQTAAMLSILVRYSWHQFSIVTSQIAGHDEFVQAVRDQVLEFNDEFKFTIIGTINVLIPAQDLSELANSEARVILLYCTSQEAAEILRAAQELGLTGANYVWIVTQSVISATLDAPPEFPVGMLGVHFDTSVASLTSEISTAIKVFAYGVELFLSDSRNANISLATHLSCEGSGDTRWPVGETFIRYLRNVSVDMEYGKPPIEFHPDGTMKAVELKIMNLKPSIGRQFVWEEIGVWQSWKRNRLDIKDIVWPGHSHVPPEGVPEKFHVKITFLEEPPFVNLAPPDPVTGRCTANRGVFCRVAKESALIGVNHTTALRNSSFYQCCSGFCIDLLEKFAADLGFSYELVRVEDGKWGTLENGKWNGLVSDLVNRRTEMVMSSLMINSERESVIDFTVPFMESGIAILVAKRTGIISPTAFLEPFDSALWMLVGFVAIQVSALTIFFFEWLSPSGFDAKLSPSPNHRFSLFRTYWLVWAVLFQAAVHVDCPRGFTARAMANVWAMFAVVFLAIYTANLAAFMITREEFYDLAGIDDKRLTNPFSNKPPLKFGTIPWSHTESTLRRHFPEMHSFMKKYNHSTVIDGSRAVKKQDLDAFLYDGSVLNYLVGQDDDCQLLIAGQWYAMTGYGIAFPRNSKYLALFNQQLMDYRENGDLERLRRFWVTGTCKPNKQERHFSKPLAIEQFLSAFLLLMSGILLSAVLLLLEHLYFKYIRKHLAKTDQGGCCALISLSMGKSLTFRGAVFEAQDLLRQHRCRDPLCDTHMWRVRHELALAKLRIRQLEKAMEAHGLRVQKRKKNTVSCWSLSPTTDDQILGDTLMVPSAKDFLKSREWGTLATTELSGILPAQHFRTSQIYRSVDNVNWRYFDV